MESKIINTNIDQLTFKFIPKHEIGMGGAIVGELYCNDNTKKRRIDGIFGEKFVHSSNMNKIALVIRDNENIHKTFIGILDYDRMELIIYNTAEYFHTIIKFFDDRITCINTGLYGVDDSSLHKEYNLYELNLKEIRKI